MTNAERIEFETPITLEEAIKLYPSLLTEVIRYGSLNNGTGEASFQFCGDRNYRTRTVRKGEASVPSFHR